MGDFILHCRIHGGLKFGSHVEIEDRQLLRAKSSASQMTRFRALNYTTERRK